MQQVAPSFAAAARGRPLTPGEASYRFWLSLLLFLLAFGFGATWDRAWHTTHPFEDFYSPPHIFIYTTFGLAALIFLSLALSAPRRAWFGPCTLGMGPIELPPSLALTLAGFGTVMLAGLLDNVWHSSFGLDETAWSAPHSMIGTGILLTWYGFLAGRLALGRHAPISRPFAVIAGVLSLSLSVGVLLGPLDNYQTEAVARAIGDIPVLAAQDAFQHTVRITLKFDLTHQNPLFVPLAAAATGFGLSLLWAFVAAAEDRPVRPEGRRLTLVLRPLATAPSVLLGAMRQLSGGELGFLLAALLATFFAYTTAHNRAEYLNVADDARNFLPLPYVVAAAAYVGAKALHRGERFSWAAAGLLFGIVTAAWWDHRGIAALLAAPAMALGAPAGARVLGVLKEPDWRSARLLTGVAVALPLLTGVLDLLLRASTP